MKGNKKMNTKQTNAIIEAIKIIVSLSDSTKTAAEHIELIQAKLEKSEPQPSTAKRNAHTK